MKKRCNQPSIRYIFFSFRNVNTEISYSGFDTMAIFEKLLGKVNSSGKPFTEPLSLSPATASTGMLTDLMTDDGSLDNNDVDLGGKFFGKKT